MRDISALKDRCISLAAWLVGLMFLSAPLASGLLAGPGWAAAGETATGAGTVDVQFEEGLLTFKTDNAQLIDVLRGLAEKARFRTVLRGDLSKPITMSIVGIALEKGIWRLVGDATMIMVHDSPRGEGQVPRLVELRVYGSAVTTGGYASERSAPRDLKERILADLAKPNPMIRSKAIQKTLDLDHEAALNILDWVLFDDANQTVRVQAAITLGRIGGEPAASVLTKGLGDGTAAVRAEVIRALGVAGGGQATQALGQVVFSEKDPTLRWISVQTLATQRSQAARIFLEVAARDQDSRVRETAKQALTQWQ